MKLTKYTSAVMGWIECHPEPGDKWPDDVAGDWQLVQAIRGRFWREGIKLHATNTADALYTLSTVNTHSNWGIPALDLTATADAVDGLVTKLRRDDLRFTLYTLHDTESDRYEALEWLDDTFSAIGDSGIVTVNGGTHG